MFAHLYICLVPLSCVCLCVRDVRVVRVCSMILETPMFCYLMRPACFVIVFLLWFLVLRYGVVLCCCAVLCCAVLCCAVLCCNCLTAVL